MDVPGPDSNRTTGNVRPDEVAAGASAADRLVAWAQSHWARTAARLAGCHEATDLRNVEGAARQLVETSVFLAICRSRGLLGPSNRPPPGADWEARRTPGHLIDSARQRFGSGLFFAPPQDDGSAARPKPWLAWPLDGEFLPLCAEGGERAVGNAPAGPPVDVLGRIHESLLGLRLGRGRDGRLRIRRSAAARKAAGVYYTPECVARYVVRHTVGRLLEARTPQTRRAANLTIVDPACGCGSFLLAACRLLAGASCQLAPREHSEEHRDKLAACPYEPARHLFGVDVDPEAVLVARRSLWLEILSGGGPQPGRQSGVPDDAQARAVLDQLTANIRCGDALTGPALRPLEGRADAVIGNPPYRRELDTKHLLDEVAATDFGRRWRTARMDLWYYFLHRGFELLRPGGLLSFIVGAYWTAGRGAEKLIRALRESAHVEEIFCLGDLPVFAGVSGRHMVLRLSKGSRDEPTTIRRVPSPLPLGEGPGVRAGGAASPIPGGIPAPDANRPHPNPLPLAGEGDYLSQVLAGTVPLATYRKTPEQLFRAGRLDLEPPADELLAALDRFTPLGQLGKVRQGIAENPAAVTGKINRRHAQRWRVGEGVFALTPDELAALDLPEGETRLIRPYHDLCDLGRYYLAGEPTLRLIYSTRDTWPDVDTCPRLQAHLVRFRPALEGRRETRQGTRAWWQLHWPREEALWESPKVIAVQMARRPSFVPAARPVYVSFSANVFVPDGATREHRNYFAAVLNSRLLWQWFGRHSKRRGVGLEINGGVLARAPIRRIDFDDPRDRRRHDRLVEWVDRMTALCRGPREEPPAEATGLDRHIDEAVYDLYGLSAADVAAVETGLADSSPQ